MGSDENNKLCPFCKNELKTKDALSLDCIAYKADCPYCGKFNYYELPYLSQLSSNDISNIAGFLYETNCERDIILDLNEDEVKRILSSDKIPKTTMQKLEKLLLGLYKQTEYIGYEFRLSNLETAGKGYVIFINRFPMSYSNIQKELRAMFTAIAKLGWIEIIEYIDCEYFCLTVKGLEHAEQLLSTNIDSKKVFIAMKFKDDNGNYRDEFVKSVKSACAKCGFVAELMTDVEHNNLIDDEIISYIKQSKFVISDITYSNNGAYYEAGYGKGLGKDVILCCEEEWYKKDVHFDINHFCIVRYSDYSELENKLVNRINATIN